MMVIVCPLTLKSRNGSLLKETMITESHLCISLQLNSKYIVYRVESQIISAYNPNWSPPSL